MNIPKLLLNQAWPIFIGQLAVTSYSIIDLIIIGHFSSLDIAIVGVGDNVFFTIYIGFSAILLILSPLYAQKYSDGGLDNLKNLTAQGFWLAIILSIIVCVILLNAEPLINISHLDKSSLFKVNEYLSILIIGVPALLMYRVIFAYASGIYKPKIIMFTNFVGLAIKSLVTLFLVFGFYSIPAMGTNGCALGTICASWSVLIIAICYFFIKKIPLSFSLNISTKMQLYLLKTGGPIGLTFFIDYSSFTVLGLLVANLGLITMASHQIAANVSYISYLIPLSIGSASSVIVGSHLVKESQSAKKVGLLCIKSGVLIAFIYSLLLFLLRKQIASFYTTDLIVSDIASLLIGFVACYHFFDGIYTVVSGVLRSFSKTFIPTIILGSCLWGIGLLGGYFLAFDNEIGVKGFWFALIIAAIIASKITLLYFRSINQPNNNMGR